jgi:1-acyl-sn-glycerol-3-phosphate acyltransferase
MVPCASSKQVRCAWLWKQEFPILPVTIRGGERVWPPGARLPRLKRVEVIYHPLFILEHNSDEETRAFCSR